MGADPQRGPTRILGRAGAGDERARCEFVAPVYDELSRFASLLEKRFAQFKTDFAVAPAYLKTVARIQGPLAAYFFV